MGDGIDNCGVDQNFDQANLDADTAGDVCDLCPFAASSAQGDFDSDSIGDACDNCPRVPNPGQEDFDNDGRGDACVPTEVIVQRVLPPAPPPGAPLPPPPPAGEELFQVNVSCGTSAIRRVELAVVMPEGSTPLTASFGPGCDQTSCAGATGLGATVNASLSRAYGPGLSTPGTRPDALYFSLIGGGPPDGRLCGPFEDVQVATIQSSLPPAGSPVPTLSTEGLAALGLTPLTATNNQVLEPAEYAFLTVDDTPSVQLGLSPALGDTTGRKWQVDLLASVELNRVVIGFVAPVGTTTAQMRFTGCTTLSGSPTTRRSCAANLALGPYTDAASSFTVGPGATASGLRGDTLYASIAGIRSSGEALPALNVANAPVALGVVEIDTSTDQPGLTLDGVGTTGVFPVAYLYTSGSVLATSGVALAGGYNPASDFDADGRSDDLDNCPYVANTDQLDRGQLGSTLADGTGDSCQCGEATGDGAILAGEPTPIRQLLAGMTVSQGLLIDGRCSVAGSPACDVVDVVRLRRAISGFNPPLSTACRFATR